MQVLRPYMSEAENALEVNTPEALPLLPDSAQKERM